MSDWLQQYRKLGVVLIVLAGLLLSLVWACWQYRAGDGGFPFAHRLSASPTHTAAALPAPSPTPTPSLVPTATATPAPTLIAKATATKLAGHLLPVPVILQELPLSCEFASMRMVSAALLGDAPSEEELLDCMPRDPNPYLGFRGNPAGYNRHEDGSTNWDNYGVYAPAVAETLNRCVLLPAGSRLRAVAIKGVTYEEIVQSLLDGYPVIVWVSKREQVETKIVDTPQGPVQLASGEHVWVVVGYYEDDTFAIHDPYPDRNGQQTLRVPSFPNWELFDHMAVFVQFGSAD
ncbi:MAG: hypothetical protein FJ026_03190 [Chloroflexi bacterium]|nr:hypothetical protein [Chloroflexota bacterium]